MQPEANKKERGPSYLSVLLESVDGAQEPSALSKVGCHVNGKEKKRNVTHHQSMGICSQSQGGRHEG